MKNESFSLSFLSVALTHRVDNTFLHVNNRNSPVQMSKVTTPLELYHLGKKLQIIGKSKKQKTTKTEKVKKNSII